MPTSHLTLTSISSTVTSGWRHVTGGAATTLEPGDFKLKLTSTTHSAVETGRRTPQQWGCLAQGVGFLLMPSVGLNSEGQTTPPSLGIRSDVEDLSGDGWLTSRCSRRAARDAELNRKIVSAARG
jgi:hypothetical protein